MNDDSELDFPSDKAVDNAQLLVLILKALRICDSGQRGERALVPDSQFLMHVLGTPEQVRGAAERCNGGSDALSERVCEILSQLLISGVVKICRRGHDVAYRLTDRCRSGSWAEWHGTYAVGPFVRELGKVDSSAGKLVIDYVEEGLNALNARLLRAATVMLGAAAELTVLDLANCTELTLRSLGLKAPGDLVGSGGRLPGISAIRGSVVKAIKDNKAALAQAARDDAAKAAVGDLPRRLDRVLGHLQAMYQEARNDQAHPTAIDVSEDFLRATYGSFSRYLAEVRDCKNVLESVAALA